MPGDYVRVTYGTHKLGHLNWADSRSERGRAAVEGAGGRAGGGVSMRSAPPGWLRALAGVSWSRARPPWRALFPQDGDDQRAGDQHGAGSAGQAPQGVWALPLVQLVRWQGDV